MVRAKFHCSWKDGTTVRLVPVYSGSEENQQFFAATPGGEIYLSVVNQSALDQFEVGKEYYVDFSVTD